MATANQKVSADELISATVKYTNRDDATRQYDLEAEVYIQSSNVQSFNGGSVRKYDNENDISAMNVADFNSPSETELTVNFHGVDDTARKNILKAVLDFMADVKASVTVNPVTA